VSKKNKFPEIKAELRVREQESRSIRKQINESAGMERWGFWADKRRYGSETRDLLLAYGFLRGMPYRVIEPKTQPNSGPYATCIQRCLAARGHEVPPEDIKAWLEAQLPAADEQEAA